MSDKNYSLVRNPNDFKLNPTIVLSIIKDMASGKYYASELARMYEVDPTTITKIVQGQIWASVQSDHRKYAQKMMERNKSRHAKKVSNLTDDGMAEIRRLHADGYSTKEIAKEFDINTVTVLAIVKRKS